MWRARAYFAPLHFQFFRRLNPEYKYGKGAVEERAHRKGPSIPFGITQKGTLTAIKTGGGGLSMTYAKLLFITPLAIARGISAKATRG